MSHFGGNKSIVKLTYPRQLGLSGLAACLGASVVHPIDVVKVNMQVLQSRQGLFTTMKDMFKRDGILSLTRGLSACWTRHILYSSLRIGLYPIFKAKLQRKDEAYLPMYKKIAASLCSGLIGQFIASPTDLMLIRIAAGNEQGYKNVFHGFYKTFKADGLSGLWRGATPNVIRGAIVTATQIASYDQIKQTLLNKTKFFKDDLFTHFTSSALAGWICTTLSSPIDVIKTKTMHMKPLPDGSLPYKGLGDCAKKIWQNEGLLGFYRGYVPNLTRIVPITVLIFVFYEQLFKLYVRAAEPELYQKHFKKVKK